MNPRRVGLELGFEGLVELEAVGRILHIDEIDHDDAAEITKSKLSYDLPDRLEVEGENGLFERFRADKLAGVDVDGNQGLGLIDDQIASGFEPHLRAKRLFELSVDAEGGHEIGRLSEEFEPGHEARVRLFEEFEDLLKSLLVIDPGLLHCKGECVADRAQDRTQLVVDEIGGVGSICCGLDLSPELDEIASIRLQLNLTLSLSRGADDPTTPAEFVNHRLEPSTLVVVGDPSRDTELIHCWHVDQKASGQGDVSRQPSALCADGVLHDLDEDLLSLAEEIADVGFHDLAGTGLVVDPEDVGEVIHDAAGLTDIEKAISGQPKIDKRGLHAREDTGDPALVEIADHRRCPVPFGPVADQTRLFAQGHPGFERVDRKKEDGIHH